MSLTKLGALIGAGLLASSAAAWAVPSPPACPGGSCVQEVQSFGPASTAWTHTLNFSGFIGAGGTGTLTSVVVTLIEAISGSLTFNNTSANNGVDFAGEIQNTLTTTVQPNPLAFPALVNTQFSPHVSVDSGQSSAPQPVSGTNGDQETALSSLGNFTPNWSMQFQDSGFFGVTSGGGNGGANAVDNGKVTVTVDYFYTTSQVPEPASIALLGTALIGLGALRRRRR